MREIKFRAWNKGRGRWDYFTLHNIATYLQTLQLHLLNGDDFCQYTGLKDDNEKEIYEGDILRVSAKDAVDIEWNWVGVVKFGNPNGLYNWGFQLKPISLKEDEVNPEILLWVETEVPGHTCEVIGNIYENPDLVANLKEE